MYEQKGRQDAYKKNEERQPVIQVDFSYIKTAADEDCLPILTATDVTMQLSLAVAIPSKSTMHDYMSSCLKAFILECGRAGGILQSDNETTLLAVLQQAASKVGNVPP